MGSIEKYQLKSGENRWKVRWKVSGVNKYKEGFRSQSDAKRFLAREENAKYQRKVSTDTGAVLNDYIKNYLAVECDDLSPKTIEAYSSCARIIAASALGNKKMKDITTEDIKLAAKEWRHLPSGKERSANTINHYLRFLQLIFNHAVKNRELSYEPVSAVPRLKMRKYEHHILIPEEYMQLLTANEGNYMFLPIVLGGWMGLRRGEVLGLRWQDINFRRGELKVRYERQRIRDREILKDPKSQTSIRTLIMPDYVISALKRAKSSGITNIDNYVCTMPDGTPLSVNTFSRAFDRALARAGLPQEIRFHDLRHTCAALLIAAGANPKEVSTYLGHSSISITMDLYADVFDTSKKERAAALNDLLCGTNS